MSERTEPYNFWFHPHTTFLDKILQFIVSYLIPVYTLPRHSASHGTDERQAALEKCRKSVKGNDDMGTSPVIAQWSKTMKNVEIIEYKFSIPRVAGVLKKWGIISTKADEDLRGESLRDSDGYVEILLRFPENLLRDKRFLAKQKTKHGTRPVHELDVADFLNENRTIPVVLHFHGGGFVLGTSYDLPGIDHIHRASTQAGGQPVILASVEYRIAPEYAFPTVIEDGLIAVSFFSEIMLRIHDNHVRKIPFHIHGVSAGGNLSAVLAMETHRRLPGLLKSATVVAPMLNPAADSVSYYLNSKSSWIVPVGSLRWGWQAYLRLPEPEDRKRSADSNGSLEERAAFGSNSAAWAASKWHGTTFERLVNPTVNLPSLSGLDEKDSASLIVPNFIVVTNEADPLADDGIDFVTALQGKGLPSSKLKHVHTKGSHYLGLVLDNNFMKTFVSSLADALFPVNKHDT